MKLDEHVESCVAEFAKTCRSTCGWRAASYGIVSVDERVDVDKLAVQVWHRLFELGMNSRRYDGVGAKVVSVSRSNITIVNHDEADGADDSDEPNDSSTYTFFAAPPARRIRALMHHLSEDVPIDVPILVIVSSIENSVDWMVMRDDDGHEVRRVTFVTALHDSQAETEYALECVFGSEQKRLVDSLEFQPVK